MQVRPDSHSEVGVHTPDAGSGGGPHAANDSRAAKTIDAFIMWKPSLADVARQASAGPAGTHGVSRDCHAAELPPGLFTATRVTHPWACYRSPHESTAHLGF